MPAEEPSLSNSSRSFDVAVVGGGVVGLAVAWGAAKRGLSVTVLERGELGGGTSRVAAGMIAPIAEAVPVEQPLLRLALASARRYRDFAAELAAASGQDPGYLSCGTLLAARDRDEAEALERELEMRRRLELPVRRVRPSEARALEPGLAPTLRLALEVPDDCAIDPRLLTVALAGAVRSRGGTLRTGAHVNEVVYRAGRVCGVALASDEDVHAEQVVIAAGAWSSQLAGIPEDARVPIRPVKGQILRLHDPSGPGLLTRVLRMQGCYLVPRGDGRYVLGATMEERGLDTSVTAGPVFELLRDAIELVPGLSELVLDELAAGIRPGTPDNAPAIGPGAAPGLHWATGHYRHGIMLAPITAEIMAAALAGDEPPEGAAQFSPSRFARFPVPA
jgi:glycine oxidase